MLYVDILQTDEDCYDHKILDFDFETKRAMAVVALEKTLYSVVAWERQGAVALVMTSEGLETLAVAGHPDF